ncbi:MAG: LCP family protein [Patescibacteria group bacterium]|nr:LCP family protein [Patescibacteria group bacterium]
MKNKYLWLFTIIFLISLISALTCFLAQKNRPIVSPLSSRPTTNLLSLNPFSSPVPEGEYNVLLLGQGDVGHPGGSLTDSMNLLHLNTVKKTVGLIFIPRDLWANSADNSDKMKINEAYAKSGLKGVEKIVSMITGLPVRYALIIDFNGFTQVVDLLGGLDLQVQKTFDDYFYPVKGKELEICEKTPEEVASLSAKLSGFELEKQFPCRFEHLHFDKGLVHVDGQTALKFSRSRHSAQDGTDFARGRRQQVILIGIKDKLLSLEALKSVDKWFGKFIKLLKTDLDLETAKAVAGLIIDPNEYQINQILPSEENVLKTGKGTGGQFILMPKAGENDWSKFQEFIKKEL